MNKNRKNGKIRVEKHQITRKLAAVVFAVAVILFVSFFLYLGFNENVTVYSPRFSPYYGTIINLTPETVQDDTAPMGYRTVYSWLMDAHCETGDYLCFYISNHHVDVTIDGERIYSLHASRDEFTGINIAKSVSSNWCIIPLEPEDAGKRFTVELTPLTGDILPKEVEILVGSNYNIILGQLRADAPQLLLATMCIALGLIIFLIQCYLQIFSGTAQWDMLFLGVFSMLLGVWRITDIRSSPLIFSGNPKVLGYISIGMLFLASPALIMFVSSHFQERQARNAHILSIVISCVGMVSLLTQILGRVDIGESRALSHITLWIGMMMVFIASFYVRKTSEPHNKLPMKLLPLLAVGTALDFLVYYTQKSSAELIYTCLFFLIYLSVAFISSYRETSKMVYRDSRTGLFNKARWNEIIQDTNAEGHIGIFVLDMNGLKKVNDTQGHEAGDRMICAFADILRNTLPSSCVICRWGGDEFTVMIPRTTRSRMDQYKDSIYQATVEYNSKEPEVELYFAIGDAFSEEHPDKTRNELFKLADENMYRCKQQWYQEKKKREAGQGET